MHTHVARTPTHTHTHTRTHLHTYTPTYTRLFLRSALTPGAQSDVMPGSFGVQKMAAYGNDTVYLTGSFRGEATVGDNYIYSLEEEIFLFKITTYGTHGPT